MGVSGEEHSRNGLACAKEYFQEGSRQQEVWRRAGGNGEYYNSKELWRYVTQGRSSVTSNNVAVPQTCSDGDTVLNENERLMKRLNVRREGRGELASIQGFLLLCAVE